MSDKPSLYVVEKKEVVILVVLFVIVTVLSFTMGVRYGESVGKKAAKELSAAESEHSDELQDKVGGTLGHSKAEPAKEEEHGKAPEKEEHGHAGAQDKKGEHGEPAKESEHGEAKHAEAKHEDVSHDAHKDSSPETAAKVEQKEDSEDSAEATKTAVDKNSDEYLLNALKESGVEPPKGSSPKNAKLPDEVKKVASGTFVIQVGSHPTRSEAESQVRQLKGKKVQAQILSPFKDRQGEWHRVVVGSYKNKREAEKEAKAMKSRGAVISYFVWRLP